jgi:Fe-S-cluster containining protein
MSARRVINLAPERNGPCTCGSGKKYKKCCGAPSGGFCPKEDAVSNQRRIAYEGARGQQRENFVKRYTAYKKQRLAEIADAQRQAVQSQGKNISCGQGCSYCCHVYVSATLPECEAIVFYLYEHEDALQNFLNNYPEWQQAVRGIEWAYKEIGRICSRQLAKLDTASERAALTAVLNTYAAQNIPCPFLSKGSCGIYEVRPYVCAGLIATTPREWCRFDHPEQDRAELLKAEVFLDEDRPYLDNPLAKTLLSNLPALINALLCRGWEFLEKLPRFSPGE